MHPALVFNENFNRHNGMTVMDEVQIILSDMVQRCNSTPPLYITCHWVQVIMNLQKACKYTVLIVAQNLCTVAQLRPVDFEGPSSAAENGLI